MTEILKRCTKCGKEYPLTSEFFHRQTKEKSGFRSVCKSCRAYVPRIRFIPLNQYQDGNGYQMGTGQTVVVDRCDTDLFSRVWYYQSNDDCEYAISTDYDGDKRFSIRMHRLVLERKLGRSLSDNEIVDHVDGDGLNNRRRNLRLATSHQNKINQKLRSDNTSGFKGVSFDNDRKNWRAAIYYRVGGEKKRLDLGRFSSPELAYEAYKKAAIELHGEFARLD